MNGGDPIKIIIPGVLRKKTSSNLYRYYFEENYRESDETPNHIAHTLFRRFASTITDSDQEQRQCVD
jgi:hypothetical protein